jgi:23S rRNA pseudouridine1911/1915/1917 synthase
VVQRGDEISYHSDYVEPNVPEGLEIIHSTNDVVITGKPAGVPVTKSGRIFKNTFSNRVRDRLGWPEATPLHRLDADTSGLILFARKPELAAPLQQDLQAILKRKLYLAIVAGGPRALPDLENPRNIELPEFCTARVLNGLLQISCKAPLREAPGSEIRHQMYVLGDGKPSHSDFIFLDTQGGRSLVLCEIHSGRKHQIRAHLAYLGYPIIGDLIYSEGGHYYLKRISEGDLSAQDYQSLGAQTHLLHSYKALVALPETNACWYESHFFSPDFKSALAHFPNWKCSIDQIRDSIELRPIR